MKKQLKTKGSDSQQIELSVAFLRSLSTEDIVEHSQEAYSEGYLQNKSYGSNVNSYMDLSDLGRIQTNVPSKQSPTEPQVSFILDSEKPLLDLEDEGSSLDLKPESRYGMQHSVYTPSPQVTDFSDIPTLEEDSPLLSLTDEIDTVEVNADVLIVDMEEELSQPNSIQEVAVSHESSLLEEDLQDTLLLDDEEGISQSSEPWLHENAPTENLVSNSETPDWANTLTEEDLFSSSVDTVDAEDLFKEEPLIADYPPEEISVQLDEVESVAGSGELEVNFVDDMVVIDEVRSTLLDEKDLLFSADPVVDSAVDHVSVAEEPLVIGFSSGYSSKDLLLDETELLPTDNDLLEDDLIVTDKDVVDIAPQEVTTESVEPDVVPSFDRDEVEAEFSSIPLRLEETESLLVGGSNDLAELELDDPGDTRMVFGANKSADAPKVESLLALGKTFDINDIKSLGQSKPVVVKTSLLSLENDVKPDTDAEANKLLKENDNRARIGEAKSAADALKFLA